MDEESLGPSLVLGYAVRALYQVEYLAKVLSGKDKILRLFYEFLRAH